jgi:hypothetical protein
MPLDGAGANKAKGTPGVIHGVAFQGVGAAGLATEAVFQNEGGDAVIAEPFGQSVTFMTKTKLGMPASRTNDDRRAGGFVRGWHIRREGGIVDVADITALNFFRL